MTIPTELHDQDLEEQLRATLRDRAGTITGPAPSLSAIDGLTAAAAPPAAGARTARSRRWAAVGIAATMLAVAAAGYSLTRPEDDTEAVSTAAATPDRGGQATPGNTRVRVINGSRWPGGDVLVMASEALNDAGISQVTTEISTELAESAVYYRPGFESIAAHVALLSHLTGREAPLPGNFQDVDADVVVQLGQDWSPLASDGIRGDASTLPYVPASVSGTVQLAGPPAWPGPGNDEVPADTPVAVVQSFLTRVIGTEAAEAALVEELFQFPLDGHTSALVRVVLPSGEETKAGVGLTKGQDRWTVRSMVSTTGNDSPWGEVSGPMPLAAGSDEAAIEKGIAYPHGAASARIWYRHGDGPTMLVELDHAALEAGYQSGLEDDGDGPGPDSPIQVGSDRATLGSAVLLKGTATQDHSYVGVFYDEEGAPITVYADSFYTA